MTRISSLFLATGLAILPISAFAQPSATPAATPMAQPATSAAPTAKADVKAPVKQASKTEAKAPAASVKTTVSTKDTKTTHAKLGTTTPAAPAKTAEPSKS